MLGRYRNTRRKILYFLGNFPFASFAFVYLLIFGSLVYSRVGQYDGNLSSLIGIHKLFADANPQYRQENFVLYENGGYDGQFFFFIAKYLYQEDWNNFPVLDSFRLRFTRIGMPILSGFLSIIFGFEYYPFLSCAMLTILHILSAYFLRRLLPASRKGMYLIYLFSPFTINSDLLLVSDGLFAAIFFFVAYALSRAGIFLGKELSLKRSLSFHKELFIPLFLGSLFFLSIRETSIPFFSAILMFTVLKRQFFAFFPLCCALGIYLVFFVFVALFSGFPEGMNPLGFLNLVDLPVLGFIKSISMQEVRDLPKFLLFYLLITLALGATKLRTLNDQILYLPIYFIIILGLVAHESYWVTFDNSSRFFSLAIPYMILVSGRISAFRFFGLLETNILLFWALLARFWFIKQGVAYQIW